MMTQIYILTWCNHVSKLYGTTLVFKTLRVGFPNARVHVIDNASLQAVRSAIKQSAEECGAEFTQMDRPIAHHEFIERTIAFQPEGTAVFLDPDLCFWKEVESWQCDKLVAGRHIPRFACEYTNCITHSRLHTSFLWVPDVEELRKVIVALKAQYFDFEPFRPFMFRLDNTWHRYDTGANLFSALRDRTLSFSDAELDCYDHLFCGTHLDIVAPYIGREYAEVFQRLHQEVQSNHFALRGAWRMQEEYFDSRAVE